MKFVEKMICLKDGREAVLRSPLPSDAEQMLRYLKTTAEETKFLTRYPEECVETPEEERAFIERVNGSDTMLMIVCSVEGNIAGSCQLA